MGKRSKNQERKKKVSLVFDESKRKDFLCGFRKRKLERKKKAQDDLQRMLKEERKRIKQENKESYKKLVVSSRPIPDIEQLLQEEYEDEDVNVKIVELSSDTLQKKDLVIGENRPQEKKVSNKAVTKSTKENISEKISGMDSEEENEAESNAEEEDKDSNLKTKKEIKQLLKKQATKKIQKSKAYQIKNKMERIKNKKKSFHKKSNQVKTRNDKAKPNNIRDKKVKKKGKRKH